MSEPTRPGPDALESFEQDRALAHEQIANATHGFVVATAYRNEDGEPTYSYLAQINPNDLDQMTRGWTIGWYQAITTRTRNIFASVLG